MKILFQSTSSEGGFRNHLGNVQCHFIYYWNSNKISINLWLNLLYLNLEKVVFKLGKTNSKTITQQ